jgi:hypothetical protein
MRGKCRGRHVTENQSGAMLPELTSPRSVGGYSEKHQHRAPAGMHCVSRRSVDYRMLLLHLIFEIES